MIRVRGKNDNAKNFRQLLRMYLNGDLCSKESDACGNKSMK